MDCWYIVQTNPNNETKAIAEIRRAGFRAYLPKRAVYKRRKDDKIPIKRWPAMVGYVFIRFPNGPDWFALRRCQGVKGALYSDGRPYQIMQSEVAAIMRAQRSMAYDAGNARAIRRAWIQGERSARNALAKDRFAIGAAVFHSGRGIMARVLAVTKSGSVRAITDMMGIDTPVEFTDPECLTVIDAQSEAA